MGEGAVLGHDRNASAHRQRHRVGRMAGEQQLRAVALEHEASRDPALVALEARAHDRGAHVADELLGQLEDGRARALGHAEAAGQAVGLVHRDVEGERLLLPSV